MPYNTGCVVELIKFLVDACDPHEQQNTEVMIGVGLNLLVIAFEVGAHAIRSHKNLHSFIKDQLCRNMISVSLRQQKKYSFNLIREMSIKTKLF